MRHFGIGRAHKGRPVRLLIDHDDVLVADLFPPVGGDFIEMPLPALAEDIHRLFL